jgi:hypothetical protein
MSTTGHRVRKKLNSKSIGRALRASPQTTEVYGSLVYRSGHVREFTFTYRAMRFWLYATEDGIDCLEFVARSTQPPLSGLITSALGHGINGINDVDIADIGSAVCPVAPPAGIENENYDGYYLLTFEQILRWCDALIDGLAGLSLRCAVWVANHVPPSKYQPASSKGDPP